MALFAPAGILLPFMVLIQFASSLLELPLSLSWAISMLRSQLIQSLLSILALYFALPWIFIAISFGKSTYCRLACALRPSLAISKRAASRLVSEHQFLYQPFARPKDQIRLLWLVTDKTGGLVLDHFDSNKAPSYTAVSYTWGDKARDMSLTINNCSFPVIKSTAEALEAIVHSLAYI
jgi:hypothetical protein